MRYVAFIHKEPNSCYGVSFPDMPGCASAGDTLDEADGNGVDALSGHVRLLEMDGDFVPPPRSLEAIIADPALADDRKGALLSAIALTSDLGELSLHIRSPSPNLQE
jgi:predicted RNase H-like HicB family nuclease